MKTKTALEKIHDAYMWNDLETAKKLHDKINKEEREKAKHETNLPPKYKWNV